MDELLRVTDLHVYYGMTHTIRGISFEVEYGETVALISVSGVGKTITLHTIIGLLPSSGGGVVYNGRSAAHVSGCRLVRCGLAHVSEGRRAFSRFLAPQNLELGTFTRRSKGKKAKNLEKIYRRSSRPAERRNQLAGILSGGEQQMPAMGCAFMSRSEMLVPNEPSMGLSPIYAGETFDIIKSIHESGTTVFLVEQNARKALSIANHAYVLETGTVRLPGTAEELLHSAEMKSAYLSEQETVGKRQ